MDLLTKRIDDQGKIKKKSAFKTCGMIKHKRIDNYLI